MQKKGLIIVGDRNREVPMYRMIKSRLTGKLRTYTLSLNRPPRLEKFDIGDIEYLKSRIQTEADSRGIDTIIESVRHFSVDEGDYIQTEQWIPVITTADGVSLIDPVTIGLIIDLFIKWVIPTLLAVTVLAAVYFFVIAPLFVPPTPYKGFIQRLPDGTLVTDLTHTEYITLKQSEHPGAFVCLYCGEVFDPVDYGGDVNAARAARDTHYDNCPWKGSKWLDPQPTEPPVPELGKLLELGIYAAIGGMVIIGGIQVIGIIKEEKE